MDIPDDLIKLEHAAEQEREKLASLDGEEYQAQWRRWREAGDRFQAAVTEYAARDEVDASRYQVEMAVKKAVRHPEPAAG